MPGRNSCSARTRSRAVALHELAAAAMLAALKLAGDHEAVVFDVEVRLRDGRQQPPIVRMGGDGRFAELVDLVDAVELLQAGDRRVDDAAATRSDGVSFGAAASLRRPS